MRVRRLDRYLLREYLAPVIYCVSAFYMVFVVYSLFKDLPQFLEVQTPPGLILRYYVSQVEYVVRFILPASIFFATLYTLWRMTRNNELTAMRASGVSLNRIMAPFLLAGAAISLGSLVLNETVTPGAKQWSTEFLESRFRPRPPPAPRLLKFYNGATRREWTIGKFDARDPGRLKDVRVQEEREEGTRIWVITAERAKWRRRQWRFYNAFIQRFDRHENPVGLPVRLAPGGQAVVEMGNLTERPTDLVAHTKKWEYLSTTQMIRHLAIQPDITADLARKRFDIQNRLATPWACLVVTLFAIPSGSRGSRQSALAGIFLAMALFGSFYAVSQIGAFLGMRGLTWPWLGAWFANIAFSLAGIVLIIEMR